MTSSRISINPSSIAYALAAIAFILVLCSIAGQLSTYLAGHGRLLGLVRLFYVDVEQNIPTAFATLLLFFAAILLTVITVLERKQPDSQMFYWSILSFGFMFMAFDEAWSFHERLDNVVRPFLENGNIGIFYHAWVVPGLALTFVLALFFLRFLFRLSPKMRYRFLMAGGLYLGGALGVELIGGYYAELHGYRNLTYSMIVTVEESLEMAGAIVFIWALLRYIGETHGKVSFHFQ